MPARFLTIDVTSQSWHILAGDAEGSAAPTTLAVPCDLTQPEPAGAKLRDAIKAAKFSVNNVVVSLGRDQWIVKDVRYPQVPPQDEPALVRFQATKELTEAGDVVLDYLPHEETIGDRSAMVFILRRSILQNLQAVCRHAGLKLQAVVPRPLALVGAMPSTSMPTGLLTATPNWTELTVVDKGRILLTRSLPQNPRGGDIRRSLAGLGLQGGGIEKLLVAAELSPSDLGIAAAPLPLPPGLSSPFLPAWGLLQLWQREGRWPIDVLHPREPKPVADPKKRRRLALSAAAFLMVLIPFVAFQLNISAKRTRIRELTELKESLQKEAKNPAQNKLDLVALRDWESTSVPWIDEMYDLAALFPWAEGFKVKQVSVNPLPRRTGKEKGIALIKILGQTPVENDPRLHQWIDKLNRDPHLTAVLEKTAKEFTLSIEVAHQPRKNYTAKLIPPVQPRYTPPPPPVEETTEGSEP